MAPLTVEGSAQFARFVDLDGCIRTEPSWVLWTVNAVPRLSIGLPVYNGEKYLAESLEALLGQTYENFELILSDNASTDSTSEICRRFANQDSRIRLIVQPRNTGLVPNHNFVVRQARGELFKWASHDDLYARDLLTRCIDALDDDPRIVLAHSRTAMIDSAGTVTGLFDYRVAVNDVRAPERFRSMLFDGWDDYTYGVVRTPVLRRTALHGSYHFADRTIVAEIGLHGPFYQIPEYLHFRRAHSERPPGRTVRDRCAILDPRRANRLHHPVVRLYGEYLWAYVEMIRHAPLSPADRRDCYRYLAAWMASRAVPVLSRYLRAHDRGLIFHPNLPPLSAGQQARQSATVDAVVPGRETKLSSPQVDLRRRVANRAGFSNSGGRAANPFHSTARTWWSWLRHGDGLTTGRSAPPAPRAVCRSGARPAGRRRPP